MTRWQPHPNTVRLIRILEVGLQEGSQDARKALFYFRRSYYGVVDQPLLGRVYHAPWWRRLLNLIRASAA